MKNPRHLLQRPPGRRAGMRGLIVTVVAAMIGALALMISPALAAGGGVLDVVITPTNQADSSTITDVTGSNAGTQVTYKVQYSCTTADCDGSQVQFSTPPADPNGLLPASKLILQYSSWVAPVGGGSIGGTDATGKVVTLGDLPAGTSGTFSVTYTNPGQTGGEVPAGDFYPDGSTIPMSATISSSSASSKSSSASFTWHLGDPGTPTVGLGAAGVVKPDTSATYLLAVNPGDMVTGSGDTPAGGAVSPAAGSYKVVFHFPAQGVVTDVLNGSANDPSAVIDNTNHTVTWTVGSASTPSYAARGGWGIAQTTAYNGSGPAANNALVPTDEAAFFQRRAVHITYPVSNFPDADANGCNFNDTVTSSLDTTVTYLDAAHTTKSATTVTGNTHVACSTPFGGLGASKTIANGVTSGAGDQDLGGTPDVSAINVPAPGETDTDNREWRVAASNQGNVAGTATIDEPNLVTPGLKVNTIVAYPDAAADSSWAATVNWTDNTGATGTTQIGAGDTLNAASGRWFTSATSTLPVDSGAILRTDKTVQTVQMGFRFTVDSNASTLIGQQETNTAHVSIAYPADADGDGTPDTYTNLQGGALTSANTETDVSRTIQYTQPLSTLVASFNGQPVVAGGGTPKPGTAVTFKVRAQTSNVWPGTSIQPQLVFAAPVGWSIVPGSAAFTAAGTGATATAPAGVTFSYATKTIAGVQRDVVVATYPSTVALSSATNDFWPTMSVDAVPTNLAVPGAIPSASVYAGDQSGFWANATGSAATTGANQYRVSAAFVDAPDLDGDSNTTESYSTVTTAFANLAVGASDALSVVKQLCVPLDNAPDGCDWVSDSSEHLVPADAGTVKYRIQINNSGNTLLNNVVAYDVLPYSGDTSLLAGGAARGSQFALPLKSIDAASDGLTVTGSASTNPARPEVDPGATGTTNDWGPIAAGQKAIKIAVTGGLAPGDEKDVELSTTLASGIAPGQEACNSVAIDSDATLPAEPPAVCVTLDKPLNAPPTVAISSPTDGATYDYGSNVPATFTCTDDDLVSCVWTDENGNVVKAGDPVDTTTPGSHTLTVKATDSIGQTATKTVTYTVRQKPNLPPTVAISSPTDGATYDYGSNVPATFTCTDDDLVSCV
ncbi:MAG TPA: hypothetical protein VFE15_15995, partial [Marmoricola sp.]|nr:hypothetical protein [Marmoricola sp.]